MSLLSRRESFKALLDGLLQTAGTVVLATVVLPAQASQGKTSTSDESSEKDLEKRADELADARGPVDGEENQQLCKFVNGAFNNSAFKNGSFNNNGFKNGSFTNGGFKNGSFNNNGFRNGGFTNSGWRN